MIGGKQQHPKHQEAELTDYVERLIKHTTGRRALHIRMSALRPQSRRPERLYIATLAFTPLIYGYEGALFRLSNDDMVIFCKGASADVINRALNYLKNLYATEAVIRDAGEGLKGFCRQFDLEKSYDAVLELARAARDSTGQATVLRKSEEQSQVPPEAVERTLDPRVLGKIQKAIAHADLTNTIRRQQVCAVLSGNPPQPVFTEVFTSMAALRELLTPDVDIHANRWLFQDLTAHLDRRVITFLGHKDDSSLSKAFSINLNVASLAAREFLNFDQKLSSDVRGTVIIELQLIDILADLEAFMFYRAFLRERRYKLCLDGLTFQSLPLVDTKRLGVDLVKIIWSPELHESAMRKNSDIMEAVKEIDPKRIILIRCDDSLALETGRALGVSLFQGYMIDDLLKPGAVKKSA